MNRQTFDLNIVPGGVPPCVKATQYDVGRTFTATIYDGTTPYTFSGDETIVLSGTKKSGKGFQYDDACTINGSTIRFETTEAMTVTAGPVTCGLTIIDDGVTIGTMTFILMVNPAAVSNDQIIDDNDYMDDLIEQLQAAVVNLMYFTDPNDDGNVRCVPVDIIDEEEF